jgi:uncharacterized protein HemX
VLNLARRSANIGVAITPEAPPMSRRDDENTATESRGVPASIAVFLGLFLLFLGVVAGAAGMYLTVGRSAARDTELARLEAERAMAAEVFARQEAANAKAQVAQLAAAKTPKPPPLARDEFKAKVMGKTPEQVIEAVGKPDRAQNGGPDPMWFYDRRTVDPVSRAVDVNAQLVFKSGIVALVTFS